MKNNTKARIGPEYEAFLVKKKYVIENYSTMANKDIEKNIGLSVAQIKNIASSNFLKKQSNLWARYVPGFYEHKDEILENYKTAHLPTLAKKYDITVVQLKNFAIKHKVYRNPTHSNIKENRNGIPLILSENKPLKITTDGKYFCETSYAKTTTTI